MRLSQPLAPLGGGCEGDMRLWSNRTSSFRPSYTGARAVDPGHQSRTGRVPRIWVDLFRIRVIFNKMGTCIQNNPYPLPGHRKNGPLSPVTGRAVREKGQRRPLPLFSTGFYGLLSVATRGQSCDTSAWTALGGNRFLHRQTRAELSM